MRVSLFILVCALLVRLFIGSAYYHPDIKSQHFHAQFYSKYEPNIYEYLSANSKYLPYKDTFNYPPTIYFLLGTWNYIANLISGPELNAWLNDWGPTAMQNIFIPSFLLILKLPYFITDLLLLAGILVLVPKNRKKIVAIIWLFNPLTLYSIYAIGQFDSLPALCTIGALIAFKRRRLFYVGVLLGIAASIKTYPILLVPLFMISTRSITSGLKIAVWAFISWLIPMIPYLSSQAFVSTVFNSSLGSLLFAISFKIFNFNFPLFIPFYCLILLIIIKFGKSALVWSCFVVTLSMLIFTTFHPQWIIWSAPFLLFFISKSKLITLITIFISLLLLLITILTPDQYLGFAILSPLNPNILTIPPISNYIPQSAQIQNLSRLALGLATLLIIVITSSKKYRE